MTKDAQSGRAYLEAALAMNEAALTAGVSNPRELEGLLRVGRVVAEFVGKRPMPTVPVFDGPRFEKAPNKDGGHIITRDLVNGLEWDVTDFGGKEFTFDQAQKACAELRTGGHADWRLPTVQELLTLVDYTRSDPAIDKEFFPNCKSSWYRTSTPYAPNSGCAWIVYFNGGYSSYVRHDLSSYVRAVRASQF